MISLAFALKLPVPKLDTFSVRVIGVCKVLPRVRAPFFNGAASILNQYLCGVLEPIPNVFCWRHRGFDNPSVHPYLPDGVHLVQRVAAEVTRQLQPASFLPAVQEPQVPSPAPAAFPNLAGTTAVQQLTTEVPVVSYSPVGNPSAVDQVTQVVQSVHSSLAGESPSSGAFQPKDIFTSVNLPVDARVPLKLKTKIWNNGFIDFGFLLANQFAEGKYQLTINPGDGSSPSLALEPITKPKKIVSIDSWVQAFHVFVGVF
ncbi:unnamed protein product, partial [Porites evermanni]